MKNYLFLFLLFIACNNTEESKEVSETERAVSFATSLKADDNKVRQLYLYSNYKGEGYVKLIHFGHSEHHKGVFLTDPNKDVFTFKVKETLQNTLRKSEAYGKNILNIYQLSKHEEIKVNVEYTSLKKDTSFVLNKKYFNISLKSFNNPKDANVILRFEHPKFDLQALKFNYYYTGVTISDDKLFENIKFEKTIFPNSDSISLNKDGGGRFTSAKFEIIK